MAETAVSDIGRRAGPLRGLHEALLAASVPGPEGVALRALPFPTQVNLRGDPGDASFLDAVRSALGLDLPTVPNTVAEAPSLSALWLGPDEWLLVGAPGAEADIAARLRAALAGRHSAVTDLTASRAVLELSGARSRQVLMKGCALDLHPRAFGPGRCVQTLLARTGVILAQTDAAPTWHLYVRNSFAPYLARWLIDAMREFAPAVVTSRDRGRDAG